MHIADGILPVGVCVAAQAIALAGVYRTGRNIETEEVVRMGMLSSVTFVVSLIHFPLGGTSIHLGLFGLTGIIAGKRALPVLYATLLFQALAFQHGGLLSLGVNVLNMGTGCLLAALIWRIQRYGTPLRAFAAGFTGIMAPAMLIALEFSLSGYGKSIYFIGVLYLAAAVIEALLTVGIISFLSRVKPAILARAEA